MQLAITFNNISRPIFRRAHHPILGEDGWNELKKVIITTQEEITGRKKKKDWFGVRADRLETRNLHPSPELFPV